MPKIKGAKLDTAGQLFKAELIRRLQWSEQVLKSKRQRELAIEYLNRKDYLRATILGFEAFISKIVEEAGKDPELIHVREQVKEEYEKCHPSEDYKLLRALRNLMAHGTMPNGVRRRTIVETITKDHHALSTKIYGLIQEFNSVVETRRILVVSTGLVPQVVTEILWWFVASPRGPKTLPDEIHLATTRMGADIAATALMGRDGKLREFCREFDLPDMSARLRIHSATGDDLGHGDDTRDIETNIGYANMVTRLLRNLTAGPEHPRPCLPRWRSQDHEFLYGLCDVAAGT